jgi:hypothetical protein
MPVTPTLNDAAWASLPRLRSQLGARLDGAGSLEEAAQRFAALFHETYPVSVALARVYFTVAHVDLPALDRAFVAALLATADVLAIAEQTAVLSLVGTSGAEPAWCDRRRSRGHLAIPLVDAAFVEAIPMLARLLTELGVDIASLSLGGGAVARRLLGGFNGLFYVPDARDALDVRGRQIIPAQDFVALHRIRTVFGMGGAYMRGTLVTAIVFSRESLDRPSAERLATLVSDFKLATEPLVSAGKIYAPATA